MLLAAAGGIALAAYFHVGESRYYPVARIAAPDGIVYTAFSDEMIGRDACVEANQRFVADFRAGCPDCTVVYARCESKDEAIRLRIEGSDPVVLSPGMALAVAGPPNFANATCESIAQDLVRRGVDGRCLKKSGSEPD